MSYCDDCIIRDICCAEGRYDNAVVYCEDKDKFIFKSVLEDIKAELNELKSHYMPSSGVEWGMKIACEIIDKHMESEDKK